jgi:peroxiredoxin Q/BCP
MYPLFHAYRVMRASEPMNAARRLLWALALALVCALGASAASAEPAVGHAAPEFSLEGSDGKQYTLAGILGSGKEGVVLAWFPKAFTPG